MTNPDGYPREVHVKFNNGTGTITYRENSTSYLMDWELEWNENYPRRILLAIDNADTTPAVNLMNSSCAQWSSGTAELKMGDLVKLGLYAANGVDVDTLFDGLVTDISRAGDGVIIVEAMDFLERMRSTKPTFTHAATYLDETIKSVTTTGSIRYISGVTEANIVEPLVRVAFSHTDVRIQLDGDNANANDISGTDEFVQQAFIADSDHFIGVRFAWTTDWGIGSTAALELSIFTDDDDAPGNLIKTVAVGLTQGIDASPTEVDFTTANVPLRIIKGQKYWIEIQETAMALGGGTHWSVTSKDTNLTYYMDEFYHDGGGGRAAVANEILDMRLDFADYGILDVADYWFDDTANRIYLLNSTDVVTKVGTGYYSIDRGLVSYYYGTITKEALCTRLIQANTGLLTLGGSDLDRTFGVYSTRGKSIFECMREIMDVFETSGNWNGYQTVMAHVLGGSNINRCKLGQRKKTGDAATYILSHPDDRSNDDEHIVIGEPSIKQTNRRNYARVTLVGKGRDGEPLVCTRSDQALSGSFWNKMLGVSETLTATDENLNSLEEVDKQAYALLDAVNRDVWQGSIRLSGQHEDMMDIDSGNDTYGSGNIITMYWKPLGISNIDMKVTGMVLRTLDTEIFVNNTDPLLKNRLTKGWGSMDRSESFISPVGTPGVVYGYTYTATTITAATLYMELCDSGGTALPGQDRQLCTKFASTDYNLNVYHAEFIAGNAYSATIGGVGQIKLYTTKTGVSPANTIDLTRTESSIVIDEEVDKFKQTKLIYEVLADAS